MKYKLMKINDKNQIDGYLNFAVMMQIYNLIGGKITNKFNLHYEKIKQNPEYLNKYNVLVEYLSKKQIVQNGGLSSYVIPTVFAGVSSSVIITSCIAFILFRLLTAPSCRESYPIFPADKVPEIKDIILRLIPKYIIPDADSLDVNGVLSSIKEFNDTIKIPLSLLLPESGVGEALETASQIVAGISISALTVATAGIASILNYLLKAFNLLKDIAGLLFKLFDAFGSVVDLLDDPESRRIVYDIFNIDFRDGPFGVKCWVDFIMSKYGSNTLLMQKVCMIFNKIMDIIYKRLVKFLSKALSFAIPDGGVSGVLFDTILSFMKSKTFSYALSKMEQAYEKMSYDTQLLFEDPILMKATLESILETGKDFVNKVDPNIYNIIYDNTAFFAFSINKIFAIVFAMLQIFARCSE